LLAVAASQNFLIKKEKEKLQQNITHFMHLDGKLFGLSFPLFSKCIREKQGSQLG